MKNLPDDELFHALESRLRNYSDEPDDEVWNNVADELSSSRERNRIFWIDRLAAVFFVAALGFLFYPVQRGDGPLTPAKNAKDQTVSNPGKPEAGSITATINQEKNMSRAGEHGADFTSEREETRAVKQFIKPRPVWMPESNTNDPRLAGSVSSLLLDDKRVNIEVRGMAATATDSVAVESCNSISPEDLADTVTESDEIPQKRRKRKSSVTVYTLLTPVLSFNHASPHSNDDVVVDQVHSPPVLSLDRFGISMEAGIQGVISRRWQYLAGLMYYHQSHNIAYDQLSANNPKLTSLENMHYELRPGTSEHSFDYSMHNVGVQAGILYTLKQHGLYHKAGVILQYQHGLMNASANAPYHNAASDYLNYQLLYRVEYRVNSTMNVFLQPSFTHSLIVNESLEAPFDLKQSRAGIGIGIVYSF